MMPLDGSGLLMQKYFRARVHVIMRARIMLLAYVWIYVCTIQLMHAVLNRSIDLYIYGCAHL